IGLAPPVQCAMTRWSRADDADSARRDGLQLPGGGCQPSLADLVLHAPAHHRSLHRLSAVSSQEAAVSDAQPASGVVATIGQAVKRLSPELLCITLMVIALMGGMLWLFDRQSSARERILAPLIEACATSVPMRAIELLTHQDLSKGP